MRERPIIFSAEMVRAILEGRKTQTRRPIKPQPIVGWASDRSWVDQQENAENSKCQYGVSGDRLWVKETWIDDGYGMPVYRADDAEWTVRAPNRGPWRPSIHMPRWASRITLEITDVRVQRLQDISEEDAKAEGATDIRYRSSRENFSDIWFDIHGGIGPKSWESNPWVWAISFRRVLPERVRSEDFERLDKAMEEGRRVDGEVKALRKELRLEP